jgi:hypothetical protein
MARVLNPNYRLVIPDASKLDTEPFRKADFDVSSAAASLTD